MPKYNTKQRKRLLDFLASHTDETLSGREIADSLEDEGISLSAVYRNLAELEREGKVQRVARDGSRCAFYRYMDADECRSHIHLSCLNCGKTYHLDDSSSDELISRVASSSDFQIDSAGTVIRGICGECRKK